MTAPAKPESDLDRLLSRMRYAAQQLESAASRAGDAVDEIESCLLYDDQDEDERDLLQLVADLHDEEHDGPQRFCSREACRAAWEMKGER